MKYVVHVHLRDTSREQLQVRIGQGEVEYGRLITQSEGALQPGAERADHRNAPRSTTRPSCAKCGCCWRVCSSVPA